MEPDTFNSSFMPNSNSNGFHDGEHASSQAQTPGQKAMSFGAVGQKGRETLTLMHSQQHSQQTESDFANAKNSMDNSYQDPYGTQHKQRF